MNLSLPKNLFKAAIAERRRQVGLWAALGSAYAAEICATAGFDWMLLDGEHSPNDIHSLLAQLQAVAPYPVHPIARPPVGDPVLIKQYLDIGCTTLLVPMVETAAQAEDMVRAVRYPPRGVRGVGAGFARASRWSGVPGYVKAADQEICLLVQAESRAALDNLDAIAGVDGVDGVFIGPSDLAASLGHLGETGHPEVIAAVEDAARRILAAGKAPGVLTTEPALVGRYIDAGFVFVAVGADVALLASGARALAQTYRAGEPKAL